MVMASVPLPFLATAPDTVPAPAALSRGGNRPQIHGLYLHLPFCFHKCHYCDFYSVVDRPAPGSSSQDPDSANTNDRQAAFTLRLIQELEYRSQQVILRPKTVFIGGGTPTLLRPDLWRQLLDALHRCVAFDDVREFTVEANPETVNPPLMDLLVEGRVNRISIGAQSFNPGLLHTLERWHDPVNVVKSVRMARDAGIDHVNLDLIFAIPQQTLEMLDTDLDTALGLEPDHLSCYSLTYEPHTAMTARLNAGRVTRMDEELEHRMYARVIDRLAAAGYEHYEISNWARPGRRCAHNLGYWHNQNWLGLGPSAASHIDGHRWKNQPHLGQYLASTPEPPMTDQEHLPANESVGEQLMLLLRLREGVAQTWLDRHLSQGDPRHNAITELIQIDMLEQTQTHLRLTERGLFVADHVIAKLL